jgi:predicted ATP-dependent endonuclease of OLD family
MKIKSITIKKFRGLVDFTFPLNKKNALIVGENGTGKSGVIDAIDFLFTGNLIRLGGTGSKGLSINKYGKHIDA